MRASPLPIDPFLPEITARLEAGNSLVLQATPGAGKTTRVPPALLGSRWLTGSSEIVVLEPRRLAAKLAARRVAAELGEEVGSKVGYQFRFENVTSRETRIRFLTEGLFIRRLLSDPSLSNVGAVVLDEFHERHLQGDLALAAARRLQLGARPDLRILVMSATLDTEKVAAYLGDAPTVRVETRQYPVDVSYLDKPSGKRIEQDVAHAVATALDGAARDILVFLPGMAEIRRSADALAPLTASHDLLIAPLHGQLSRGEQDIAVTPSSRTKVILSTNVAETSLTIPGVGTVVDSGLARIASHSWWSGLPALRTRPISKASAIQRAGRAGRTGPGRCLRLYTRHEFETRASFEVPEIQRADLAQTLLELKALRIEDLRAFPWFEAPSPDALDSAERLLFRLGALDARGLLTELGRRMVTMPAHPRLARLVMESARRGYAKEGAFLAAFLSEARPQGGSPLDIVESSERERRRGPAAAAVRKMADRLTAVARTDELAGSDGSATPAVALRAALLAGFPDRVARLREDRDEVVFCGGGSASVPPHSHLEPGAFYVVADAEETRKSSAQGRGQTVVRALAPIEPEWLFDLEPAGVSEEQELIWDGARQRVEVRSRIVYEQLVLDESRSRPSDGNAATRFLIDSVLGPKGPGIQALCDPEDLESLNHRLEFLRGHGFEAAPFDRDSIRDAIGESCAGMTSAAEIRQSGVIPLLLQALPAGIRDRMDRLAPSEISLPRRRRVRVNYDPGKPPWIESRLQDFFGMTTGPAVLEGRVPLTLHLLAPNQRAVQVTTDLAGFWKNHYPQLRKELGRRYPKHRWPEDPLRPDS